jgi:hypothetical protein
MRTFEELIEAGTRLLQSAAEGLLDGSFVPVIFLGDAADGTPDLALAIPPAAMNSPEEKESIYANAMQEIQKHGYVHALMVSDVWYLKLDPATARECAAIIRQLNLSTAEAESLGMGKRSSKLIVAVQTANERAAIELPYEQLPNGGIVFEPVVVLRNADFVGRFRFFGETCNV